METPVGSTSESETVSENVENVEYQSAQYVPNHELQPLTLTVDKKINHMMRYFDFKHLPTHLQPISEKFFDMATWLDLCLVDGPEKTVAIRKLLEAKDCAVRANIDAK